MTCYTCGGIVEWQGPLTALSNTKCLSCGAINNQVADEIEDTNDDFDPDEDGGC